MSAFLPGLVSVTFRAVAPETIVEMCAAHGLRGIEWGGDVHVPPGEATRAARIARWTSDAGLSVVAYGSYFRCDGARFEPVLEAALHLGAPAVRVWAGERDASEATQSDFARILDELRAASELAAPHGVRLALEFHGGTLTSNGAAARRLLEAGQGAFDTLWQPLRRAAPFEPAIDENEAELASVIPFLRHVHVYEWAQNHQNQTVRLGLGGSKQWPRYFAKLRDLAPLDPIWALLEFVPGDDPAIFEAQAQELGALCQALDARERPRS